MQAIFYKQQLQMYERLVIFLKYKNIKIIIKIKRIRNAISIDSLSNDNTFQISNFIITFDVH